LRFVAATRRTFTLRVCVLPRRKFKFALLQRA
jgi:hypothetical protein